ncbi:MAG: hypothetical protein LBO80_11595 [Treponema sp.]|jgi:hypothetical protein|nr:hypothetical protein [Treponema sp.]
MTPPLYNHSGIIPIMQGSPAAGLQSKNGKYTRPSQNFSFWESSLRFKLFPKLTGFWEKLTRLKIVHILNNPEDGALSSLLF